MALTPIDQTLVQRCLDHKPGAWSDFVDRFLGLIYHVVQHTSYLRSVSLRPEDAEDVAADVLVQIIANDYAVLRQFRGDSSLARSYLTVVAQTGLHSRTRQTSGTARSSSDQWCSRSSGASKPPSGNRHRKPGRSAKTVAQIAEPGARCGAPQLPGRGGSYEEISTELNIPVNSIGPILSRARNRLRKDAGCGANRKRILRART